MNNYIEALALSGGDVKNKTFNSSKKSNGESFGSILNNTIINEKNDSIENSLKGSASTNKSGVFDTEKLHQYFADQLDVLANEALERLGAFFGFGKELMGEILKTLNIDPKDLLDPAKKEAIAKALAKKLGLVKDKEDALFELIKGF